MNEFQYTHDFDANGESSLVDSVYYNDNTQELLVTLMSADSYLYSNVPFNVYTSFDAADSLGYYYNTQVKRRYGPGVRLSQVVFAEAPATVPQSFYTLPSPTLTSTTGKPYGNTFVSLAPESAAEALATQYTHVVHFTVEGGNEVKTYSVEAGSDIHEAVDKLVESASALGIDITVKGVFVSFE